MPSPRIDNLNSYNQLILNGNFDFWQRNTSFTGVANNAYTADRWQYSKGGAMVGNITRSTDVPTVAQSGFASQYSLLYTITTPDSNITSGEFSLLNYKIEGFDYAAIHGGQSARLQFWVKSSITGTYGVALRNSAVNRSYVTTITINAANTWERKTIDFTTDASGTWLLDNQTGLQISIALDSSTDFRTGTLNAWQSGNFIAGNTQANFSATNGATFQLAQVMLVPGSFPASTDLKFKRAGRTIGDELRMCQRYYEKSYDVNTAPGTATALGALNWAAIAGPGAGGTFNHFNISFKVPKRASNLSITSYSPVTGTIGQVRNTTANVDTPGGGGAGGENGNVMVTNNAQTAGQALQAHWTLDAEL